jgi:uncharacterized damage-inducible protein DinB
MNLTDLFIVQLDAEAPRTRRALERVPDDRGDWKPHEKSMPMGRLAMLNARMPSWIAMIVKRDELDLQPPTGSNVDLRPLNTSGELVQAHDEAVADARAALADTSDAHLVTNWRLLVAGKVVNEAPRHVMIRDTFMHLSHHRGQLTVYLRLNGAQVPAIYGPSADDTQFA